MSSFRQRIRNEIDEVDDPLAQIPVLERAIVESEREKDLEFTVELRFDLLHITSDFDYPEKTLAHFAKILITFDQRPELVDESRMLWMYKWVLMSALDFPQISRVRIEGMFADFERRITAFGAGRRALNFKRVQLCFVLGDDRELDAHTRAWLESPRDELSDCEACECDTQISIAVRAKHYDRALSLGQPIVDGRLYCSSVPERTYSTLVAAALRSGDPEAAEGFHRAAVPLLLGSRKLVTYTCDHVHYLIEVGRLEEAQLIMERTLPYTMEFVDSSGPMHIYGAASRLIESRVAQEAPRSLRLPADFPQAAHDVTSNLPALAAWFRNEAEQLAEAFDQRNGNSHHSERLRNNHWC